MIWANLNAVKCIYFRNSKANHENEHFIYASCILCILYRGGNWWVVFVSTRHEHKHDYGWNGYNTVKNRIKNLNTIMALLLYGLLLDC